MTTADTSGAINHTGEEQVNAMRRQRGITLLECLVSVVVFGVGILAAAQCLLAAYDTLRFSEQVDLATMYAQQQIEQAVGFGTAPNMSLDQTSVSVPDVHFPGSNGTSNLNNGLIFTYHLYNYDNVLANSNLIQYAIDAHWVGMHGQTYHVILQTIIPYRISPT